MQRRLVQRMNQRALTSQVGSAVAEFACEPVVEDAKRVNEIGDMARMTNHVGGGLRRDDQVVPSKIEVITPGVGRKHRFEGRLVDGHVHLIRVDANRPQASEQSGVKGFRPSAFAGTHRRGDDGHFHERDLRLAAGRRLLPSGGSCAWRVTA